MINTSDDDGITGLEPMRSIIEHKLDRAAQNEMQSPSSLGQSVRLLDGGVDRRVQ